MPERRRDPFEIDLSLAGAGDPVDQRHGEGVGPGCMPHHFGRGRLVGIERRRTEAGVGRDRNRFWRDHHRFEGARFYGQAASQAPGASR